MFRSIGTTELLVIGLILVLFFGSKRLPEFSKGLKEALREFKKAAKNND